MIDASDSPTYRGPTIPATLGSQLQRALGLETPPRTFGDWVDAMVRVAERGDLDVDRDALCTTADSPHRAAVDGETQHYQCVLDPVILPFLAADVETVDIETQSPAGGTVVELTVTERGIDAEPSSAVTSFGVAADVAEPDGPVSPAQLYGLVCPYVNAFPTREAYQAWADETDAVTMALGLDDTLELARALGRAA